jgi:carbonic anhydrase
MSSQDKKLAIAITCSDWRLHQDAVHYNQQLAKLLDVDGVDLVVVPGPDGLYKGENAAGLKVVTDAATLLAGAHNSVSIAVVGHYKCAGNPVSDEQHDADAAATAQALRKAMDFKGPIVAVSTVYHDDSKWSLKEIARIPANA